VNRMLLVTAAQSLLGTVAESARTDADSLMDILLRIIGGITRAHHILPYSLTPTAQKSTGYCC